MEKLLTRDTYSENAWLQLATNQLARTLSLFKNLDKSTWTTKLKSIVIYIIKEEIDLITKTVMITFKTAWVKEKKGNHTRFVWFYNEDRFI
ncbi:hypothetical protein CKF48_05460 [Cytobacillus kochii]|uniref:Uncharacterized protein n=1 Tax=Cytobacillus kochii TaxID=859143 RepID=A0A248TF43_9BACI|nr:hypothetical protein CKF48_05460 [Cytobacillus kochii]